MKSVEHVSTYCQERLLAIEAALKDKDLAPDRAYGLMKERRLLQELNKPKNRRVQAMAALFFISQEIRKNCDDIRALEIDENELPDPSLTQQIDGLRSKAALVGYRLNSAKAHAIERFLNGRRIRPDSAIRMLPAGDVEDLFSLEEVRFSKYLQKNPLLSKGD